MLTIKVVMTLTLILLKLISIQYNHTFTIAFLPYFEGQSEYKSHIFAIPIAYATKSTHTEFYMHAETMKY